MKRMEIYNMSGYWNKQKRYWLAKIKRLKGTPGSVASGIACGVAVSFTPFVGAHFVLAMSSAWILRGNIVAAALGTAFGNPWTFPFIWISILYTGRKILGAGYEGIADVNFTSLFSNAFKAVINMDFNAFWSDVWPILYPMIIGCIPYVLVSWWLSYIAIKGILEKRRKKIMRSGA